ncbi:hypothetical protein Gotur_024484 [Gossypium turneri]
MTFGHTLLSESEKLLLREVFTSVQDSGSLSGYICTYVFVRFSSPCSHREMYSPESNSVDIVPTVEEYTTLLHCPRIQVDKVYSRAANILTFTKKLTRITGMSEQWVIGRIKQKGENRCIPWRSLRDQILAYPYTKKKVDVFALIMYGLVISPKALGHIDEAVTDLFD